MKKQLTALLLAGALALSAAVVPASAASVEQFTLRAIDAHSMIGMSIHPARVLLNFAVLAGEALVLLAEVPLYGFWTGLITLGIILYNFAGVWAMARILLPKLLGRRGKALVKTIDSLLAPREKQA